MNDHVVRSDREDTACGQIVHGERFGETKGSSGNGRDQYGHNAQHGIQVVVVHPLDYVQNFCFREFTCFQYGRAEGVRSHQGTYFHIAYESSAENCFLKWL